LAQFAHARLEERIICHHAIRSYRPGELKKNKKLKEKEFLGICHHAIRSYRPGELGKKGEKKWKKNFWEATGPMNSIHHTKVTIERTYLNVF
jgi:hypothetical protein